MEQQQGGRGRPSDRTVTVGVSCPLVRAAGQTPAAEGRGVAGSFSGGKPVGPGAGRAARVSSPGPASARSPAGRTTAARRRRGRVGRGGAGLGSGGEG